MLQGGYAAIGVLEVGVGVTPVGVLQLPGFRVENAQEQGDEHAAGVVLADLVIDPGDDTGGGVVIRGSRLDHGLGHGHEQGGGDPLAGDVSHADAQFITFDKEVVVEIPADLAGRLQQAVNVKLVPVGKSGEGIRHHTQLDIAADIELLLHAFLLPVDHSVGGLQLVHIMLQGELRLDPGLQQGRVDRLQDIVRGPQVEALRLVGSLTLGGEKNDRYVPCLWISLQLATDLVAIDLRHHDIQQDQVRCLGLRNLEGDMAIDGHLDLVVIPQDALHHIQVFRRVVHRQ